MLIFGQMTHNDLCIFSHANCMIFKLRWQTKYRINQLETNSRNSSRTSAFRRDIIIFCQPFHWTAYFDKPKGVKLGISKIANYNSRWILSLVSGEALLAALKAWKKNFWPFWKIWDVVVFDVWGSPSQEFILWSKNFHMKLFNFRPFAPEGKTTMLAERAC